MDRQARIRERFKCLEQTIEQLQAEINQMEKALDELQVECSHPKMERKRSANFTYYECPDCGYCK